MIPASFWCSCKTPNKPREVSGLQYPILRFFRLKTSDEPGRILPGQLDYDVVLTQDDGRGQGDDGDGREQFPRAPGATGIPGRSCAPTWIRSACL